MIETKMLFRKALVERCSVYFAKRVSVVFGPAGSGKTSLVKQWIDANSGSALVVWFRVPNDVLSSTLLLEYFLSLWSSFIPLDYFQKLLKNSTHSFLKNLGAYLSSNMSIPIILVIDDVHQLSDYLRDRFFQDLIEEFPSSTRFIFLSRELPALDHIQLSVENDLSIVMEDLNFSEAEVYELARSYRGFDVSPSFLKVLWQQFRGWPLATVAALESPLDDLSHLRQGYFDELFVEVLNKMLLSERQLLLDMAVFDQVNFYILRQILDSDLSEVSFKHIVSKGYFFRENPEYYRMHDTFRQFCLEELARSNPKRESVLRARLARHYLEEAQFSLAFEQFLRADLLPELIEVLEFNAWILSVSANSALLLSFTERLADRPEFLKELLKTRIQFLLMVFALLNQTRLFDEVIRLGQACFALELPDLSFYASVWIKNNVMWAYLSMGQIESSYGVAQELLQLDFDSLMERDLFADTDRLFGIQKSVALVLSFLKEDYAAIGDLYRGILDSLGGDFSVYSPSNLTSIVANSLGVSLILREGVNLDDPRVVYLENVADRYPRSIVGFLAIDNLVPYFIALGYFERAEVLLEPYFEWDLTKGLGAVILSHYAVILLNRAYFKNAYFYAESAFELLGTDSVPRILGARNYLADLAELAYYLGLKEDLQRWVELLNQNALRVNSVFEIYSAKFMCLYYLLEDWNCLEIQSEYLVFKSELAAKGLHEGQFNLKIFEFFLAYYRRDTKQSLLFLREIETEVSYENMRWFARQVVVRGLSNLPDLDLFPRLYSLVHSFNVNYQASQSLKLEQSVKRLEITLLGSEVLRLDGVYLDLGYWLSSQSRFVFYYLLFFGAADSARLAAIFWPDKSEAAAGQSLRKAITWVRGMLGKSIIVYEDGLYSIGSDFKIDCDVFELRKFVKLPGLDVVAADGTSVLGAATIERFVSVFFLNEDFAWLRDLRIEVSSLQSDLLRRFVVIMRRRGLVQNVLFILDRFRRENVYVEESWRWSFECLADLGESARLALLYQEMLGIFQRDLGILPSKVTRDLYGTLVNTV